MICPKCGARLAQGSIVCPICGKKIKPSAELRENKTDRHQSGYDREYESNFDELDEDSYDDEYVDESAYEDDDYSNYNDSYGYEDQYEPAPKKVNRILVIVITTVLVLIVIMIVLIVLMLNNGGNNKQQIPYTVEKLDNENATEQTSPEETITAVIDADNNRVTSGKNVYELEDGELKLVEYNDQGQVVRIPQEIGGYPVTAIGPYAFKNNTSVEYLKLPVTMKTLDDYALYDIVSLKEIVMPESISSIGTLAIKKVQTAFCVKGSFAWSYMQYMADQVVEGDSLSLDGNTTSTTQYQTAYTPTTTAAVTSQPGQATPQPTPAPTQPTPAPTQPTPAPTQPTPAPTQPTPAPTEPTPAPTEPTPAPTEPTPAPTEPTPAPTEPTPAPTEPATQPSPSETEPTERNAENILAKITADSGGTVVANSYLFFDANANGVEEAFALVDIGGRKEIWYNGEDSSSVVTEIFPITDVASCSVAAIQNGNLQYVLIVTTSTGAVYSCIYGADGTSGYMVADLLPGILESDGISLTINNGANGVAYLAAANGSYSEYQAVEISQKQFLAMPGGVEIWSQAAAVIGAEPANLRFWNRTSAVGNLIQIAFTDVDGSEKFINVNWTENSMQFENGALIVQTGAVKASYTGLEQIMPQTIPQTETEPVQSATEVSLTEGTAVTLSSEGTSYTADLDGDGAGDYFTYRTQIAEDGLTSSLIVNVNGTDYIAGSGTSAIYKIELCDLNTSDGLLNLVVVGTGADGSVTSFKVYGGTDFNNPIMEKGYFSILNGYGTAEYLYNTAHILTPVSSEGKFDEDGEFTIAVTNPVVFENLGRYVCRIPYSLASGYVQEAAYNEMTGDFEYDLLDLTSLEQFNYLLAGDTNLLASASAAADPAALLAAGTQVFPRKLVLSSSESAFYLYVEDTADNKGYLPLSGQTLFQSVP